MKKVLFTILSSVVLFTSGFSQACGSNGPSQCTPAGGPAGGGFEDFNTTQCVEKGVAYNYAIQFTMFSQFNYLGQQTIDSLQFVNISNLPCGLCWSVNKSSKTYSANEDGCLKIVGTSYDSVGQYQLGLQLNAWINGGATAIPVSPSLANDAGIKLFLRVKANGSSNCPNVDTSSSAPNLTANPALCAAAGIQDVNGSVSSMGVFPNPSTGNATMRFFTSDNAQYTVAITDVTGKEVASQIINTIPGVNEMPMQKGNLTPGVYFVTLHHDNTITTRKWLISE